MQRFKKMAKFIKREMEKNNRIVLRPDNEDCFLIFENASGIMNILDKEVFHEHRYGNPNGGFKVFSHENGVNRQAARIFTQGTPENPTLQINLLGGLGNPVLSEEFSRAFRKIVSDQDINPNISLIDLRPDITRQNSIFLLHPEGYEGYRPFSSGEIAEILEDKPVIKPVIEGHFTSYELGTASNHPRFTIPVKSSKTCISYPEGANLQDSVLSDRLAGKSSPIQHIIFESFTHRRPPEQFPDMTDLHGQLYIELRNKVTPMQLESLKTSVGSKTIEALLVKQANIYEYKDQEKIVKNAINNGLNIKRVVFSHLDNATNKIVKSNIFQKDAELSKDNKPEAKRNNNPSM